MTPRGYTAEKPQLVNRLARIEGQVRGVIGMVEEDRYCIDVLTQINAIQAALDKVALGLLDGHARHCVIGAQMAREQVIGPPGDLTDREIDVLKLIALGHTNAEIAQRLYLSVRTVESHRAHIQQKLSCSTRADLVSFALEHDLMGVREGSA